MENPIPTLRVMESRQDRLNVKQSQFDAVFLKAV
jgi:hypothetical protein